MGKKIFAVLLILTIAFSMAACGKKKKSNDKSTQSGSKQTVEQVSNGKEEVDETSQATEVNEAEAGEDKAQQDNGSSSGINYVSGEELLAFYTAFDDAISKFEQPINEYATEDFSLIDVGMDPLAPLTPILNMGMYDSLEVFGTDEGQYREKSGGVIKFGKEFTREEDGFDPKNKKGDVVKEEGQLDTSANTLTYEYTVKRSGELIERVVEEVVMLPDGTFIAQVFSKYIPRDERIQDKGNAYFIRCGKDELVVIKASFEPDVNFTYNSIVGKGDISPEDMAQGYAKLRKTTVRDGKTTVEKY
jgi:hypothetical protein